jgi:hypothetical protein
MAVPIFGDIIQVVGSVIDDLHDSGEEKRADALERLKLVQEQLKAQTEINRVEAGHSSIFVAGWRPAVGWVCGFALAYASIIDPLLRFVAQVSFGYDGVFPIVDTNLTMQVLLGMLGLAGMRSWEGRQGVKRDAIKKK